MAVTAAVRQVYGKELELFRLYLVAQNLVVGSPGALDVQLCLYFSGLTSS